ncbi:MAG: hypothetical protein IKJ27_09895 [Clostridia bacterium]|nr:hypothetical protein [Clostridia bacterium]
MSDSDVKIYHSKSELNKCGNDLTVAFDAVIAHRTNGNIDKARKLGEILATITPTGNGDGIIVDLKDHLAPRYFAPDILYQIKVLLVFACETLLQIEIPESVVSTTAISSMYESIRLNSQGFYSNIANGAAFTFYYLAIQKEGELSDNIGEAFAMLCSVKNKEGFVKAGKTVWNLAVDIIEKEIEKTNFIGF